MKTLSMLFLLVLMAAKTPAMDRADERAPGKMPPRGRRDSNSGPADEQARLLIRAYDVSQMWPRGGPAGLLIADEQNHLREACLDISLFDADKIRFYENVYGWSKLGTIFSALLEMDYSRAKEGESGMPEPFAGEMEEHGLRFSRGLGHVMAYALLLNLARGQPEIFMAHWKIAVNAFSPMVLPLPMQWEAAFILFQAAQKGLLPPEMVASALDVWREPLVDSIGLDEWQDPSHEPKGMGLFGSAPPGHDPSLLVVRKGVVINAAIYALVEGCLAPAGERPGLVAGRLSGFLANDVVPPEILWEDLPEGEGAFRLSIAFDSPRLLEKMRVEFDSLANIFRVY